VNFDHAACYRDRLHENSKTGRQWCRQHGPASRTDPNPDAASVTTSASTRTDTHGHDAEARMRRATAAQRYQPAAVRILLVAQAPPEALDRYFYFPDVDTQDSLFRSVARSVLGEEPTRANKAELLERLRDRGIFLIDLKRGSGRRNGVDPLCAGSRRTGETACPRVDHFDQSRRVRRRVPRIGESEAARHSRSHAVSGQRPAATVRRDLRPSTGTGRELDLRWRRPTVAIMRWYSRFSRR
jgi:hypothetical protein